MPEPTYLELVAADGKPLRHKYFQQQEVPRGLALTLPGDNYGVDGPLLYYPNQLLWEQGWDTAAITYGYQSAGIAFSPLVIADVLRECQQAVTRLLTQRSYPRLVLIGKSLGASLVAFLCQQQALPETTLAVYITPPLGPMFNPVFQETTQPACLALGTADRFYDAAVLSDLQKTRAFQLVQVDGADHSMNVPGDLDASLEAVKRVAVAVVAFISSNAG